ncbi:hypothetical protein ACER0A_002305 [Haloimpatiens sp. FM7315]
MGFTEKDNLIFEKYKKVRRLLRKQKELLRKIDELERKRGVLYA